MATAKENDPSGADRTQRRQHRSMPSWAIDLIRDGVPGAELRENGQRAVWDALGRTALAAINAGHSRAEWENEVARPVSRLGHQNRVKSSGKERTVKAANDSLNSAWERAMKRAIEQPAWTPAEAAIEAARRSEGLLLVAADPDLDLSSAQRDLLVYASRMATAQGSVSVNLPRLATAKNLGLGEKAVRLHLDHLVASGLLVLAERGRARTKTRAGKANVYRLPDREMLRVATAFLSRETRQVGLNAQSGGPVAADSPGPLSISRAHQTVPIVDLTSPTPSTSKVFTSGDLRRLVSDWIDRAAGEPRGALNESRGS